MKVYKSIGFWIVVIAMIITFQSCASNGFSSKQKIENILEENRIRMESICQYMNMPQYKKFQYVYIEHGKNGNTIIAKDALGVTNINFKREFWEIINELFDNAEIGSITKSNNSVFFSINPFVPPFSGAAFSLDGKKPKREMEILTIHLYSNWYYYEELDV